MDKPCKKGKPVPWYPLGGGADGEEEGQMGMNTTGCLVNNVLERSPILVVEDDPQAGELMLRFIEKMQMYSPVLATTCSDALTMFCPDKYFVVILDLKMDGSIENGIQLAQAFRRQDDNVVIAVVTGYYPVYDPRVIETVDDLLRKPIDFECLQSKLYVYAIQFNRRRALKSYVDVRIVQYKNDLAEIKKMESQLKTDLLAFAAKVGKLDSQQGAYVGE